jgi:hypothetical protein
MGGHSSVRWLSLRPVGDAESAPDATSWGQKLYQAVSQSFVVVEVEVPCAVADLLFRLPNLDHIGPARFADDAELAIINQTKIGAIRRVNVPTGGP